MTNPPQFTGDFLQSIIETIVFEKGPISYVELIEAFKGTISDEEIKINLGILESRYFKRKWGLKFIQTNEGWQFVAILDKKIKLEGKKINTEELLKKECYILALLLEKGRLSQNDINFVFGDDCSHYLTSLKEKGFLIKENQYFDLSTLFFINFNISSKDEFFDKLKKKNKIKEESVFIDDYYGEQDFDFGFFK